MANEKSINKMLTIEEAIQQSAQLRQSGKKLVLVGGCFDILHVGHVAFLSEAKKQGDVLMVLLESDARIKELKGNERPVNTQEDRALLLSSLEIADFVVCLTDMTESTAYDDLIFALKPAIIATTKGDDARVHKERQAQTLGIPLVDVVSRVSNQSTSRVSALLRKEL